MDLIVESGKVAVYHEGSDSGKHKLQVLLGKAGKKGGKISVGVVISFPNPKSPSFEVVAVTEVRGILRQWDKALVEVGIGLVEFQDSIHRYIYS